MRLPRVAGLALLLALTIAPANARAAEPLVPLVSDWQQHFRIDADTAARDGSAVVNGNVWNISRWNTKRIQLLVEGLDAGGQSVTQRVIWLGIDLPSGMHAYFQVSMPPAASYRVSVFAFDSARGRWG